MARLDDNDRIRMILAIAKTGNVSEAAKAGGCSRQAFYDLLRRDVTFATQYDEAMEEFRKGGLARRP